MAKVDFRKTERRLVCGNRNVAAGDNGKCAAKAESIYRRYGRDRKSAQDPHTPLQRFLQQALELHAITLLVKKFLQILARGKTFAGSGENKHAQVLVEPQFSQDFDHLVM